MPRWVIYIKGGKGFASRSHILLDEDTRPMVFTSLKAAKAAADKYPGSWIEQEPDGNGGPGERPKRVRRTKGKQREEESGGGGFQLV